MDFKKLMCISGAALIGFSISIAGGVLAKTHSPDAGLKASIARGKYLVEICGCSDCHTPFKIDPKTHELVQDMSRNLSGAPENAKIPNMTLTVPSQVDQDLLSDAWKGPWGTSFPANITPDKETGIGNWTFQDFERVIREGKYKSQWSHRGDGRPLMPPMPWQNYIHMTNQDLHDIFNYLKSIKPIKNKVPEYIPPRPTKGK
jgi:hypothetical protein